VVRLAAALLGAPRAGICLIEGDHLVCQIAGGAGSACEPWLCSTLLAEQALRDGRPIFLADAARDEQTRAAAGDVRFYGAAPLMDADGCAVGVLCVGDPAPRRTVNDAQKSTLVDLAALAMSEIALDAEAAAAREESRLDRERTVLALSAAGLAAYEWDLHAQPVMASDAVRAMVGWDPAKGPVIDRAEVVAMLHPDDREQVAQDLRDSLAATGRYAVETRIIRPIDGRVMWIASSGALVAADGGEPHQVFGVIQDVTARKTEEDQRETLVAELDHRVKNVLAAVQSLAAQSARKAASLEGFLKTFAGRLKSMASAHQLLTATRWRGAGMHNIAAAELGGLAPGQTRWSGPDVVLTPRGANAMSLALHELATNAVKFGSLSTEVGRVEVTWRRTDDGGLELLWQESHGPAVTAPTRRGFGSTLLEKVTGRELGGSVKVDYRAEGVRAVVTVGPSAFTPAPAVEGAKTEAAPGNLAGASIGGVSAQQPIEVRGLKVLIVEDALLLALELEAGLTEAGAEVVGSAADVGEAMRMTAMSLDAAVLDANLNGQSVQPVAEALAARGVPFVFATGYGDDKMLPSGFDAPVIRKPYDVTQVAAALSEVTGRTAPAPA
jgi:PAS domain S-box-containing protein